MATLEYNRAIHLTLETIRNATQDCAVLLVAFLPHHAAPWLSHVFQLAELSANAMLMEKGENRMLFANVKGKYIWVYTHCLHDNTAPVPLPTVPLALCLSVSRHYYPAHPSALPAAEHVYKVELPALAPQECAV